MGIPAEAVERHTMAREGFTLPKFDFQAYQQYTTKYGRGALVAQLCALLRQTIEMPELELNQNKMAKLKRLILSKLAE
ncbi:MAG: hypothetical protein Q7N87_03790 [Candidatus Uhrbacteria bacterium]|nr:hypothetical protein [Candidatus Uhrbacteria bacterium]